MKAKLFISAIIVTLGVMIVKQESKNNVCKTFGDYYTDRDTNENCYYNPDGELTTPQIITRWGYPVETHKVITEDGYILTLFRIPSTKTNSSKSLAQPILVQHGYKSNSKCYVVTGKKSLGFILADHGYDVWLGNFRGTIYSRNHTHLKDTDDEFWNFSFHEMGVYDIAAKIDYIYNVTRQKVTYIGFSMGSTIGTIYSTTHSETSEKKVKIFIQLAPFVFAHGMGAHTSFAVQLWPYVEPIGNALTGGRFYPETYSAINKALWRFFCTPYPIQMIICTFIDTSGFGFDYDQVDPETFPVAILPLVEDVSMKTVSHISQFVSSGTFRHFDYGVEENLRRYGYIHPPEYDLSRVRVATYIIRSNNDGMCGKEGIEKFNSSLPENVKPYDIHVVSYDKFNHIDFLLAKDVVSLLYDHLIKFMEKV